MVGQQFKISLIKGEYEILCYLGVVTAKRGFYTLRHILPKHRYIQKNC